VFANTGLSARARSTSAPRSSVPVPACLTISGAVVEGVWNVLAMVASIHRVAGSHH
jgi:hypothetical protein